MRLSEQAVFRWVLIVTAAALSIILLALLVDPLVGALWGLALVCLGGWHLYRWASSAYRGR